MQTPTPLECHDMFNVFNNKSKPFLNNQTHTLVLFHCQNFYVKDCLDKYKHLPIKDGILPSNTYSQNVCAYLNRVSEILDNNTMPFSNIIVLNNVDEVDFNSENNECVEGSFGAAVYQPLMNRLIKWGNEHPSGRVMVESGKICQRNNQGFEEYNFEFQNMLRDKILGFQKKTKTPEHHIVIAGLFNHACSVKEVGYLLGTLKSPTNQGYVNASQIMIHILEPFNQNVWKKSIQKEFIAYQYKQGEYQDGIHFLSFESLGLTILDDLSMQNQDSATIRKITAKENYSEQVRVNVLSQARFFRKMINLDYQKSLYASEFNNTLVVNNFSMNNGSLLLNIYNDEYYVYDRSNIEALIKNKADLPNKQDIPTSLLKQRFSLALGMCCEPSCLYNPMFYSFKQKGQKILFRGLGKFHFWGPNQHGSLICFSPELRRVLIWQRKDGQYSLPISSCQINETSASAAFKSVSNLITRSPEQLKRIIWGTFNGQVSNSFGLFPKSNQIKSFVIRRGYLPIPENTLDAWAEVTYFVSILSKKEFEMMKNDSQDMLQSISLDELSSFIDHPEEYNINAKIMYADNKKVLLRLKFLMDQLQNNKLGKKIEEEEEEKM